MCGTRRRDRHEQGQTPSVGHATDLEGGRGIPFLPRFSPRGVPDENRRRCSPVGLPLTKLSPNAICGRLWGSARSRVGGGEVAVDGGAGDAELGGDLGDGVAAFAVVRRSRRTSAGRARPGGGRVWVSGRRCGRGLGRPRGRPSSVRTSGRARTRRWRRGSGRTSGRPRWRCRCPGRARRGRRRGSASWWDSSMRCSSDRPSRSSLVTTSWSPARLPTSRPCPVRAGGRACRKPCR